MAVALYLRVSTEEQRERQSIATQLDFALRYCALHQLTIHQTYADDGISGTVPVELRPLGARLLEDVWSRVSPSRTCRKQFFLSGNGGKPSRFGIAIQGWKKHTSLRMMPPNSCWLAFLNRWTRH